MQHWVAQFRRSEAPAAVSLRQVPGLEVAESEGFVWVRGGELDNETAQILSCLPVVEVFDLCPDGQLVVRGRRVPTRRLPEANWVAIRDWFELQLPAVAWPGRSNRHVALRLVRSSEVIDASLLLTSVAEWLKFGTQAPVVRLDKLRFAACEDGRVLVHGNPLPALPGTRFFCIRGVAVPAGWRWQPAVDASIVADVLQVTDGDVALLVPDDSSLSAEIVAQEQFVRATRSAIRATAEALTLG